MIQSDLFAKTPIDEPFKNKIFREFYHSPAANPAIFPLFAAKTIFCTAAAAG